MRVRLLYAAMGLAIATNVPTAIGWEYVNQTAAAEANGSIDEAAATTVDIEAYASAHGITAALRAAKSPKRHT